MGMPGGELNSDQGLMSPLPTTELPWRASG